MRRKSERNKAKGSPEKKVEKPTRKSARRRNRRSPSTSSDQDAIVEDTAGSAVQVKEIEKETNVQTCLQSKELEQPLQGHEETVSSSEKDVKAGSPENEDNAGSVWKVARADASPGEIQKLKLCRQRNTSEASSDATSSSRKSKSSKWQESGEGIAEEVDSADEQLVSCTRTLSSVEQPNDPSSSYPSQDSNEEVSDSKEILPETTSANLLSDNKPNIDQHGESNEANCAAQIVDSEPAEPSSATTAQPAPGTDDDPYEETAADAAITVIPKEDKSVEDTNEKSTEVLDKEASVENVRRETSSEDEEDEKAKVRRPTDDTSSDSNDELRAKNTNRRSSERSSPRTIRRKHRNKYRDSSNSETPDSEEEAASDRKTSEPYVEEEEEEEKPTAEYSRENEKRSVSPERANSHLNNVEAMEIEHCEPVQHKSEDASEESELIALPDTQTITHKPVKVNLKRSL